MEYNKLGPKMISSYPTERCVVCGGSAIWGTSWFLYIVKVNKWVQFLCSPECCAVFKLNPLAYEQRCYDDYDNWISKSGGVYSGTRGWTLARLREEGFLIE